MTLASRFWQQPYLLLTLTALFWAGNLVLSRGIAGHVPPMALAFFRCGGAFLILLPFAWSHLVRDWSVMRRHMPLLIILSATGFSINNVTSYIGLQYTQALNALLLQSALPLIVAVWALILLGIRLTWAQSAGIVVSMSGVLIIVLHGDFSTLANIDFNIGDLFVIAAMTVFGIYSTLMKKRPTIHQLSVLTFTAGCGATILFPGMLWEISTGYTLTFDMVTIAVLIFSMIFPAVLSYLFFNRGIQLIGPNRAAPFMNLIPLFGSAMAIVLLGEKLQLFHIAGYVLVLIGIYIASRRRDTGAPAI